MRYHGNDYSVPTRHGHLQVLVRGYVHEVTIACASEVIARHPRSYEREAVIFDPLHYLALLEQKVRALDQAAPLAGCDLPPCFATLRRSLEARLNKHGSRDYVHVLRLLETFSIEELTVAIEDALQLGTIGFEAVSICCSAGSSAGRLGWICRTILMCRWPKYERLRLRTNGSAARSGRMSETTTSIKTPQLLLEHHLKMLRLPRCCASTIVSHDSPRLRISTTHAICCG